MSNVGQAALIVVGTVVGAYFGNPQLGFMLGALAGSALFPTQLPPGPQMKDNTTTTASVGEPVPLVFGTCDVAGTVIWLSPVSEYTTDQSAGKGGPQQKTYNYTQSIAIGLCERVDDTAADSLAAIGGISRIWENGAIVWDIRPQLAADSDLGSLAETDAAYAQRLETSAAYGQTFVLYLGDELQEADPTIEAVQGMGQAPAFRGLAYIVYPNRLLQEAQGFRHPSFRFEVFQAGTGDCTDVTQTSNEVLYPWLDTDEPSNPLNINTYQIMEFDNALSGHAHGTWSGVTFNNLAAPLGLLTGWYGATLNPMGYSAGDPGNPYIGYPLIQTTGAAEVSGIANVAPDPQLILEQYHFQAGITIFQSDAEETADRAGGQQIGTKLWLEGGEIAQVIWCAGPYGDARGPGFTGSGYGYSPPWPYPPYILPYESGGTWQRYDTSTGDTDPLIWSMFSHSAAIQVTRAPNVPADPCYGLPPSLVPGYGVMETGQIVKCGAWTRVTTANSTKVLQRYAAAAAFGIPVYPLNPCLIPTDPNYDNETFWDAAYATAVAAGLMTSGRTYQANGLGNVDTTYPCCQTYYYTLDLGICTGSGGIATLAEIIAAVCKRAGLTAIDVTDMETVEIPGYAVSSICTATEIITPLRSIGFFDGVESSGVMRFQARGKPIVATLTTDDIGAYEAGGGSDGSSKSTVPPSVSTVRAQDEDLPRMIRYKYKAVSRDYEDGEADSPFRLATTAVNDIDASIPVCLGDVQAAKCAEVLWADAWASRTSYEIAIDQSWPQLEVGDCIGAPVDGVIQRMRIVSEAVSSGVLRKFKCCSDDGGAYISYAVASTPLRLPQVLVFIPTTVYELLDLPCLFETDNNPGFYVAAQPSVYGASWAGAVFYKSIDGGATFASAVSVTSATPLGTITTPILASEPFTWDDTTVIEVHVADPSITFESRTDDAVLAGANCAAMGANGRWELVQFATATQIDSLTWHLTRLLRGRRGTEYVMGSSTIGDAFIMVSLGTLARIVLGSTEIGASRVYNAVSIGQAYTTSNEQTFIGEGVALRCFCPENPAAQYDTAGNVVISWIRRSRIGQTLMSGVDIPLGEATEAFSIDILEVHSPSSPEIVLRTLTSSSTSVIYTRADFEMDSGSPLPSTIKVAIYQLSAITGRGTPQIAVLTIAGV